MSPKILVILILLIHLLGCAGGQPVSLSVIETTIPVPPSTPIYVQVDAGTLNITPSDGEELIVRAWVTDPKALRIEAHGDKVEIVRDGGNDAEVVQIQVPVGSNLEIRTFAADVSIDDLSADLSLFASAGQVMINGFSGSATVWAGRGDMTVTRSSGDLILITEHGAIEVDHFTGQISMSTIMGTLVYSGIEQDQNDVRLEADHGPIRVILPPSANTSVSASSTSGEVICIGLDIQQTVDGCRAQSGAGEGSVSIRTVSGQINLQIISRPGDN
jgi:hypothetical protein